MLRRILPALGLISLFSLSVGYSQEARPDQLRRHTEILASDSLQGRQTGTPGCEKAARYIKRAFESTGLTFPEQGAFQSFDATYLLRGDSAANREFATVATSNVLAILPGSDPVLKNHYIIIGAHYDHLGLGGPHSGSRRPDTTAVHNGADDNASGVATLLELADILKNGKSPLKRSLIFIAFSAEEIGLLGSAWYTDHPVVPLKQHVLMINLDMVGRMDKKKPGLQIGGTGTFANAEALLNAVMEGRRCKASYAKEGYGPSDHASFYSDSIPVLYFSTGAHADYHTPADDAELLNYKGMALTADIIADFLRKVDADTLSPLFLEAGPREGSRTAMNLKVRLGIMPDFGNTAAVGVGVGAVNENSPAQRGGLLKGDVITAIDGKPVKNIYDYMDVLKSLTAGQSVSVDFRRGKKSQVVLIQL